MGKKTQINEFSVKGSSKLIARHVISSVARYFVGLFCKLFCTGLVDCAGLHTLAGGSATPGRQRKRGNMLFDIGFISSILFPAGTI